MPFCTIQGKQLYYEDLGSGQPLLFLHGNTASSLLFYELLPYYQDYRCIVPDFLGNGKSQRIDHFSNDLWFDQALQIIELLESLHLQNVILIGTSGGAITAMNIALERPNLILGVIADSFMGEKMIPTLFQNFEAERECTLQDPINCEFYRIMQGDDYEDIVRKDTKALMEHVNLEMRCIHKTIEELQVKTLLLGSLQDDLITHIDQFFSDMKKRSHFIQYHIFPTGAHPSLCTNASESTSIIKAFIKTL